VCELLLDQQLPHPARASDKGSLALIVAAGEGHYQVCQVLLSQPTHPALADDTNSLALGRAAAGGHLEVRHHGFRVLGVKTLNPNTTWKCDIRVGSSPIWYFSQFSYHAVKFRVSGL
jgi:ankyrin repeat protein